MWMESGGMNMYLAILHIYRHIPAIRHSEKLKPHYELYTSASYMRCIVASKEMVFRLGQHRARYE